MDGVTQGLLGAAIGEAFFRDRLGRRAAAVGAALAVLPDFDFVTRLAGPWASMRHHRGLTHSLPVLLVAAPLFAWWLHRRWPERGTLRDWLLLAWAALITHPLLDWCTSYGTQLLAPFTDRRYAIDAVAIIDPLYSLPLLVAALAALLVHGRPRLTRGLAASALVVTTAYLGLGYVAGRSVEARAWRGLHVSEAQPVPSPVVALRATPTMLNLVLWQVVARRGDGTVLVGQASVFGDDPVPLSAVGDISHPAAAAALASEHGRTFAWFADGFVTARVEAGEGGTVVTLADHRYGLPSDPAWSPFRAYFVVGGDGSVLAARRLPGNSVRVDLRRELGALVARALGSSPLPRL